MLILKLPEFEKEFKYLCKKYPSLESDFQFFENLLKTYPRAHIRIQGLGDKVVGEFYKVKKFRCKSIAGQSQQSGIRIIYRYLEEEEKIELTYIEMYHKNQKSNHDIQRIQNL